MGTKVLIMLAIVFAIDLAAYWFGRRRQEAAMRSPDVVVEYRKTRTPLFAALNPGTTTIRRRVPAACRCACGPAVHGRTSAASMSAKAGSVAGGRRAESCHQHG